MWETDYTYDYNGKLLTSDKHSDSYISNQKTYSYDPWGNMTGYSDSLGETASYTYYADGLRQSKVTGGVTYKYYYNGDDLINDTKNGSRLNTYVMGTDGYINREHGSTEDYYFKNLHGDVTFAFNSGKWRSSEYNYYAWGAFKTNYDYFSDANYIRYSGQFYDKESNLIYLRARYYDNEIMRFITPDTHWNIYNMIYGECSTEKNYIKHINYIAAINGVGLETPTTNKPNSNAILQSNNLYVYALNNPTLYYDKDGEAVSAYGITASIGIGFAGYEGMYLWATDDSGNFALLAVSGYVSTVGASIGAIGMLFPTMPTINSMYGYGFSINGSLNGIGAGITFGGENGEYQGYIIQGGVGGEIWIGGDGSYTTPIFSGNINNISGWLKSVLNRILPDELKIE